MDTQTGPDGTQQVGPGSIGCHHVTVGAGEHIPHRLEEKVRGSGGSPTWLHHGPGLTLHGGAGCRGNPDAGHVGGLDLELVEGALSQTVDLAKTETVRCVWSLCVCVCVCASYGADPLSDGLLVDLLPHQRVGVAPVDVVGFDLGAAAVFGFLPGDGHGGAVAAQQGDAVRSAGSRWDANKEPDVKNLSGVCVCRSADLDLAFNPSGF